MNQLLSVWDALDPRKRIIVAVSVVAMFASVLGLARLAAAPNMALLYAGLDGATSGEIITALEGRGVAYEVRGASIYIDSSQRDEVRLSLASEGLPANGVAGYELLDGLSGFGTTSQMFDAAYWRAKEGELARTILASPNVRTARVHISNTTRGAFGRSEKMSASVIVGLGGSALGASQAKAMRFLVASAVSGLAPEDVSVIDAAGGIVLAAGADTSSIVGDDIASRTAAMRSNIERLLAARVGPGKAVVEVNIDADMNSETTFERVLDPEGRVAISSEVEENSSSSTGGGPRPVTVASNLPEGDVPGGEGSSSNGTGTRETVNYEVSEIRREKVKVPGEIRRISVAVLVDGVSTVNDAGETTWSERSEEELSSLRELVQSAIGYDAARGDVVTISSLQFSNQLEEGTAAQSGALDFLAVNGASLLQMGLLAGVALALGLLVVKPILTTPPPGPEQLQLPGMELAVGEVAAPGEGSQEEIVLNPEVLDLPSADQLQIEQLKEKISSREEDSKTILEDWLDTEQLEKEEV